MKDVRVEIRFKNNILYQALVEQYSVSAQDRKRIFGKQGQLGIYRAASEDLDVNYQELIALVNLKKSPVRKDGTFTTVAVKIANGLRQLASELFPLDLYSSDLSQPLVREVDSSSLLSLRAAASESYVPVFDDGDTDRKNSAVRALIATLPEKHGKVISARFGIGDGEEKTLSQCAEMLGVSPERVRQIESRALRMLRNPSRASQLCQFA